MRCFLLRHAEATPGEPDEARPLTPAGIATTRELGAALRGLQNLESCRVYTSTLLRARQTAAAFLSALNLPEDFEMLDGLEPEASAETALNLFRESDESRDVLIIGHNPHLELVAARLLGLEPGDCPITMKKASLLCLDRFGGSKTGWHWSVRWLLAPELYRGAPTVSRYDPAPSR